MPETATKITEDKMETKLTIGKYTCIIEELPLWKRCLARTALGFFVFVVIVAFYFGLIISICVLPLGLLYKEVRGSWPSWCKIIIRGKKTEDA